MKEFEFLKQAINELEKHQLKLTFNKLDSVFYDEPPLFFYSGYITPNKKYFKQNKYQLTAIDETTGGSGISFFSREKALARCLGESIERLSISHYQKNLINFSSINNLNRFHSFDINAYSNRALDNKIFGWVKGFNLTKKIPAFVPAQLVYFNYPEYKNEFPLAPLISTGAAGGFNQNMAILNGIYEVVERDTFMTTYLTKIRPKKICLSKLMDKNINNLTKLAKEYNLELHCFEITNDLQITTFMTLIIDRTGIGPAVAAGLKTDLNSNKALFGSIEEAFLCRLWVRYGVRNTKINPKINPDKIILAIERGLFWYPLDMIKHLEYLIDQQEIEIKLDADRYSDETALKKVCSIFLKKNINIFYANISMPFLKKINYSVYKVIIPKLQPLYLNESDKNQYTRWDRLRSVSNFFGQKKLSINQIPHFFL